MAATKETALHTALTLQLSLSSKAQVLTDPTSPEFKTSMQRWSDENIQIPPAILLPGTEEDVSLILQTALTHHIPLTIKSGGNSPWSTAPSPAWIIDLSLLTSITISPSSQTATIQSGILTKELNLAIAKAGYVIPCPSGGKVAYIPFLLGGGANSLAGLYGMASDSLVSARVITSKGVVEVSATSEREEERELFWGLKGAGWFFGIVAEVTVRIYKLENEVISWTVFYPAEKVVEVAGVLESVVNEGIDGRSSGMCAIVAPPGGTKPMIMINITHFRPSSEAEIIMAPLLALNPVPNIKKTVECGNVTDSSDAFNKHGGLNTIVSCGLQRFDGRQFIESLEQWKKMVDEALGAKRSMFMFTWFSNQNEVFKRIEDESSAWSHRDCAVWFMGFMFAEDLEANKVALRSADELVLYCQKDQKDEEKAMFPSHTRGDNLKYRYRGEERVNKLRALKKTWDPEGVFTRQFLDD